MQPGLSIEMCTPGKQPQDGRKQILQRRRKADEEIAHTRWNRSLGGKQGENLWLRKREPGLALALNGRTTQKSVLIIE
jgi:hypothetical protein